jgi:hypothetical protein
MIASPLVISLSIAWATVAVALILVLIYRSIVSMKREGQLFLDPGEAHLEAEQQTILRKLDWIAPYVLWLSILCGVLFLITGAIWVYQGFTASPGS